MTAKSKPPEKKTAVAKKTRVRKSPRNRKFGLEVVESEDDLTISLLQVDITEAQKTKPDDVNDETNFLSCVIAQAVSRSCAARLTSPSPVTGRRAATSLTRSLAAFWRRGTAANPSSRA
jgi:hypothetical protein